MRRRRRRRRKRSEYLHVVSVSHNPLVSGEVCTGLEHTRYFAVSSQAVWSVARGLDGVSGIEGAVPKGLLLKVTRHDFTDVVLVWIEGCERKGC